jgi:hypothetical protein
MTKTFIGFIALGVCLGVVSWLALLSPATGASQEKAPKRTFLTELPKIKNCTQHIKVVRAELLMQGDSQVAALELENEAYIGVVSISIEQIANKTKQGVVESGFTPDKPPMIVIPPGERKTITVGNLEAKSPIRIGGVMFSDGTEEGCESSLKTMRQLKDYNTQKDGHK